MIVGSRFGWGAVSPEPMDWTEYQIAVRLLAEERVGTRVREAEAQEDAAFQAARKSLARG